MSVKPRQLKRLKYSKLHGMVYHGQFLDIDKIFGRVYHIDYFQNRSDDDEVPHASNYIVGLWFKSNW